MLRRYHNAIRVINDMLRALHAAKLRHFMWDGPNVDVLQLESQLIELRTACQRREYPPDRVADCLRTLSERLRHVVSSSTGYHPSLTERMLTLFGHQRPKRRVLSMLALTFVLVAAASFGATMLALAAAL